MKLNLLTTDLSFKTQSSNFGALVALAPDHYFWNDCAFQPDGCLQLSYTLWLLSGDIFQIVTEKKSTGRMHSKRENAIDTKHKFHKLSSRKNQVFRKTAAPLHIKTFSFPKLSIKTLCTLFE